MDAPGSEVEQRDLDFLKSLLQRSPQGGWERLNYEGNANRLQVLKGHLMVLAGRYEIARKLYEMALSTLPVQHTSAIPALANVITLTCDKKALRVLQENYPASDLSRYWSQIVGCD